MLWSCDDNLVGIAVTDGEHPCPAALADNRAGLAVEAAVRHAFLNAGLHNNVDPVTDLKPLDNGRYRGETPLA